jgi:branched-chain amino acid transport system permease protein
MRGKDLKNAALLVKKPFSFRLKVFLLASFILAFLPALTQNYYFLGILIYANIYSIFSASWDILGGVTGIFSLGHALFFGVAAYMSGALNLFLGLPPWMTIPIGGAFGVIVGSVVAVPSLRLKNEYFALASLIFPSILTGIIFMYPELTGGEVGLYSIAPISGDIVVTYYSSLLLMLVSIFVLVKILNSQIGLIFRSIRDDKETAEASGIDTTKYKFLAFALSGFFAGIAGGFQAHLLMSVGPSFFDPFYSLQAMINAALGGMGTIVGAIGGSYLMSFLNEALRSIAQFRVLVYALVLILVFRYLPGGIMRLLAKRFRISLEGWSEMKKIWRKGSNGIDSKN